MTENPYDKFKAGDIIAEQGKEIETKFGNFPQLYLITSTATKTMQVRKLIFSGQRFGYVGKKTAEFIWDTYTNCMTKIRKNYPHYLVDGEELAKYLDIIKAYNNEIANAVQNDKLKRQQKALKKSRQIAEQAKSLKAEAKNRNIVIDVCGNYYIVTKQDDTGFKYKKNSNNELVTEKALTWELAVEYKWQFFNKWEFIQYLNDELPEPEKYDNSDNADFDDEDNEFDWREYE